MGGPTQEAAAVSLAGISFAYGSRDHSTGGGSGSGGPQVLQELSLEIPPGSVTAILGPNGVGKTTLLNILLGWLRPDTGTVRLFGRDSSRTSRREMGRLVSLVPQDEHIPFEYTLLDYVLLGRAPHLAPLQAPRQQDLQRAAAALERVGLKGLQDHPVSETSGGEKQLAMVARSLAQEPRILLMDEPTAHLDLHNKRRTVDLVHSLRDEGVTVILTTHDPDFAGAVADRMILLHQGRLLAEGEVEAVMTEENLRQLFAMNLAMTVVAGRRLIIW